MLTGNHLQMAYFSRCALPLHFPKDSVHTGMQFLPALKNKGFGDFQANVTGEPDGRVPKNDYWRISFPPLPERGWDLGYHQPRAFGYRELDETIDLCK